MGTGLTGGIRCKANYLTNMDRFATPIHGTVAGLQLLQQLELTDPNYTVLDPCVGHGHMAHVVKSVYPRLICNDIVDLGYPGTSTCDFIAPLAAPSLPQVDGVIMNPPFTFINEFLLRALDLAQVFVACLGRIQLLEGKTRYATIFREQPPNQVGVFVKRLGFWRCDTAMNYQFAGTQASYAWFVWDVRDTSPTTSHITWFSESLPNDLPDLTEPFDFACYNSSRSTRITPMQIDQMSASAM